jgi:hypothetical protein
MEQNLGLICACVRSSPGPPRQVLLAKSSAKVIQISAFSFGKGWPQHHLLGDFSCNLRSLIRACRSYQKTRLAIIWPYRLPTDVGPSQRPDASSVAELNSHAIDLVEHRSPCLAVGAKLGLG